MPRIVRDSSRLIALLTVLSTPLVCAQERFWTTFSLVYADKSDGSVHAWSHTSFVYYYGEVASAWVRTSLIGGGLNVPPQEEMDNCGGGCAEAHFGYQPYQKSQGYQPSKPGPNPATPFDFSQVFPSSEFQTLLNGLWSVSGQGANSAAAIYQQTLPVQANSWFGIAGGQTVQVVWVVLNPISAWAGSLSPDVLQQLEATFPFYNTITELELTPAKVNLLANLTAWTVLQNSATFQALFRS